MTQLFYLSVVEIVSLISGIASKIDTEIFENVFVDSCEEYGGMRFRVFEVVELFYSCCRIFVCIAAYGKRYEKLVSVHTGVFVAHVRYLEVMYGFDDLGRYEQSFLGDTREKLECVEQER